MPTDYCTDVKSEANKKGCEDLIATTVKEFNDTFKQYDTAYNTYTKDNTGDNNKLIDDYNNLSKKLEELKGYVDNYSNKYLTTSDKKDSKRMYDEIVSKYSQLVESRRKLDQQIYDLYVNDYDSVYSNKQFVDSTVVTGILWTMIVTFMLYYIIVKM